MRKLAKNRPGVTLVGDPPSLRSFYSGATVALIPLTEGGGTRLKVLEAMAVGLPVIATAKAVEGLAIVPDHAFLLAETDADFVDALGRLGKDKGLRTKLAENGRKYVFERHSQMTVDQAVCSAVARWKETLGQ